MEKTYNNENETENVEPILEDGLKDTEDSSGEEKNLQEEVDKLKDQLFRTAAELDNTRKRHQKEKEDLNKYAVTQFARELLGVADNLRRALDSTIEQDNEAFKSLIQGVEMVEKDLLNVFQKFGVKTIEAINNDFDPNLHQAMFELECEGDKVGKVIEVMQQGYVINDRLLRPALVGIGKEKKK